MNHAIVIGSNGGIGQAFAAQLQKSHKVWTVSRQNQASERHRYYTDDEGSLARVAANLKQSIGDGAIEHVVIAVGMLHDDTLRPEKRLEDLCSAAALKVINTNTLLPMAWLQALMTLLQTQNQCRVTVLSARVGSIGDNRLGGWYSYRASKAALNMMLQCAAVELARRARGVKLIAFHPGTTDTALSAPFQANVPEGKLFTPTFVAEHWQQVANAQPIDGALSFVDWAGEPIIW